MLISFDTRVILAIHNNAVCKRRCKVLEMINKIMEFFLVDLSISSPAAHTK